MGRLFLSLFFLIFTVNVYSQYSESDFVGFLNQASDQELVNESAVLIDQGFYIYAERITNELLNKDPENYNFNYRKGFLILLSKSDFNRAIPFLEKAIQKVDKNFDSYSAKETSASINAIYHLACCYQSIGKIEESLKLFENYLTLVDKKEELIPLTQNKIQQCKVALNLVKKPLKNTTINNLGQTINSPFPDYSSIISADGSALFFTSRRPWENGQSSEFLDPSHDFNPEDIYFSLQGENKLWSKIDKLPFCKPDLNEASVAVNSDERGMFIYKDETGQGDIYYVDLLLNKVDDPQKFNSKQLNTDFWETHLTINANETAMYFVSDRSGGFGGRDIYQVLKQKNGEWGKPENLGDKINTAFDEDSPFISVDGKNLYFSSDGPLSMGGFDIFVSKLSKKGEWENPENLGYPINSYGDDLYFTTTMDGSKGYFSSFRNEGFGEKDIYEVTNHDLEIEDVVVFREKISTIENIEIPSDLKITFKCIDCKKPHEGIVYPRKRDNLIVTSLVACKTYEFSYFGGKSTEVILSEKINAPCKKEVAAMSEKMLDVNAMTLVTVEKPITQTEVEVLPELPVIDNKSISLNYFFKYNDSKIELKGSKYRQFIRNIEKQLKANDQKITILIHSSASKVPTVKYPNNQALSDLRAENTKYDLITHFQKNKQFKNRITVIIKAAEVSGPAYENDKENIEKYQSFQFVFLKTE